MKKKCCIYLNYITKYCKLIYINYNIICKIIKKNVKFVTTKLCIYLNYITKNCL